MCQKFEEFLKNIHILGRKRGRCLKLVKNHLLRHALCFGDAEGASAFSADHACRPKGFAFRYPSSQHFAKKLATGNFFYEKCPLGFESF